MNRKLKALGLALVAALALSVVVASAQAAEFHTQGAGVVISGGQLTAHKYTSGGGFGTVECVNAKFEGTSTAATSKEQTISPSYSNCVLAGSTDTLHVAMNGCDFLLTAPTVGTTEGKTHIKCATPGNSITRTLTSQHTATIKCTVHIPAQDNLGVVTFHNGSSGGKKDITSTWHITGITSQITGGFFNCGTTEGHKTAGTYTGSTTLTGTSGGAPTDVWVE